MMFDATPMNPAELAAMTEFAPVRRTKKAGGQKKGKTQKAIAASELIANEVASTSAQPTSTAPLVSNPITPANRREQPEFIPPEWSSGHVMLAPYVAAPETTDIVDEIINKHRLRSGMIKAQIKLTLQAMATVRFATHQDGDYDTDEAKAKARKRADDLYREVVSDPSNPLFANIAPYHLAMQPLDAQRAVYEKEMAKLVKRLPIYEWAKSVKGLGDVGLATIVGECGDVGTYRSVSAVWKRMGLAVFDGNRQGNPGKSATAEDWTAHGYVKTRRSVMWNVGNSLILSMGKFRPLFGEDLEASEYTYYQKVFAARCRHEMAKFEKPVTESKTGKESYSLHAANRAKRYTEKRMLRNLWIEWRRA
ncbi:MAG: hypothetical protein E5Y73_11100 [Mesorhizobium sp.]|uniref:hypothetical protein n=1 Tax=Mesorhizobium sp. TaxID=1871066 RepID=UPI001220E0D8|nr:hypothetical protein [Mesorhizobium sp.]TIL94649.1 MAG: hypothetical protein E5Y73_11100 [Mesorhizobium sp.]